MFTSYLLTQYLRGIMCRKTVGISGKVMVVDNNGLSIGKSWGTASDAACTPDGIYPGWSVPRNRLG
jgi:hypothetical protein